jgi:hypothetical protein
MKNRGNSFMLHWNVSAKAWATLTAEYASLHCPMSISLGMPSMKPRSLSKKRNFPQAKVSTTESLGVF